jgi:hypothetical protein
MTTGLSLAKAKLANIVFFTKQQPHTVGNFPARGGLVKIRYFCVSVRFLSNFRVQRNWRFFGVGHFSDFGPTQAQFRSEGARRFPPRGAMAVVA